LRFDLQLNATATQNMTKRLFEIHFIPTTILLRFAAALVVCWMCAASPMQGQTAPKVQVFAGYSYLRFESTTIGFTNVSNLNGWNFSPAYNFTKHFGIAADASGHYGNHQRIYSFLVGPQILYPKGNGLFFGHLLFGKGEDKVRVGLGGSSNGRAVVFGVGYDHAFTEHFAFRVVQADYLSTKTFGASQNNLRVSTGLLYHWGERKK